MFQCFLFCLEILVFLTFQALFLFYLFCLSTMVFSAMSMAILHKFALPTLIMFFIGSICFATSDIMLTGAYFKPGKRSKAYNAIYSVFYYIAQFIIAFSIFFLV